MKKYQIYGIGAALVDTEVVVTDKFLSTHKIDKGFVKASNFKRNTDKLSYLYLLTPKGLEEKANLTTSFLKRKIAEHEIITQEIAQLKRDTQ